MKAPGIPNQRNVIAGDVARAAAWLAITLMHEAWLFTTDRVLEMVWHWHKVTDPVTQVHSTWRHGRSFALKALEEAGYVKRPALRGGAWQFTRLGQREILSWIFGSVQFEAERLSLLRLDEVFRTKTLKSLEEDQQVIDTFRAKCAALRKRLDK